MILYFFRDCMVIATVNSCTSLYGGVAVFSVLGFMAKQQNVTIADVADSGNDPPVKLLTRLILSQTTNLRLFQTERVCRRQFYI